LQQEIDKTASQAASSGSKVLTLLICGDQESRRSAIYFAFRRRHI